MPNIVPEGFVALPKSERQLPTEARAIGPVNPHERIEVSIYLRRPHTSKLKDIEFKDHPKQHLTRQEYKESESADPNDLAKIKEFALKHNLTITDVNPLARKITLYGTAAAMTHAFPTELQLVEYKGKTFRGRSGPLHIPRELDQIIIGVAGMDNREQAQAHVRRFSPPSHVFQADIAPTSFPPKKITELYDFPTDVRGNGQCIAIIELGGGFRYQDLQTYFQRCDLPVPKITTVSVDGGFNNPTGNLSNFDIEVDLDIEIAGTVAPESHFVIYFAPNTDQGFIDAINTAIFDEENNPSVISISWGNPEIMWTEQSRELMNQALISAALLGITVCCSAGDHGSKDAVNDGRDHVDFPASSPYVLACGGTRLTAADTTITSEEVWNDGLFQGSTGGGVSDFYDLPDWQRNAGIFPISANDNHIGRGVPDVAGDADPLTGYQIVVDGFDQVIGGTSAVSPLWAGLIALRNQRRGQPIGFLNPVLYQNYSQIRRDNALRDITSGNNGDYSAGPGWDPCTGLGVPDGSKLLNFI